MLDNCYEKITEETIESIKRGRMPSVDEPEIVAIYSFTKETFSDPDFSIQGSDLSREILGKIESHVTEMSREESIAEKYERINAEKGIGAAKEDAVSGKIFFFTVGFATAIATYIGLRI